MYFNSVDPIITTKFLTNVALFEGFRSRPYICPSGVLTVGYGHTGKDVNMKTRFTVNKALDVLYNDLMFSLYSVKSVYDTSLWTDGMFRCFTDFVFNCGIGTLRKSSLHKLLLKYQDKKLDSNLRYYLLRQFPDVLRLYVYSNKIRLKGLERRRQFEISLLELHD